MCDECTWHHKTFLVQLYWHLAIKLYCIVFVSSLGSQQKGDLDFCVRSNPSRDLTTKKQQHLFVCSYTFLSPAQFMPPHTRHAWKNDYDETRVCAPLCILKPDTHEKIEMNALLFRIHKYWPVVLNGFRLPRATACPKCKGHKSMQSST